VFDGEIHVHYSQAYVEALDGDDPYDYDLFAAFSGQANGLCGGATPGLLRLVIGLHTGSVGFTVEAHDFAPPVDESWEEVVEVSFPLTVPNVQLIEWGGTRSRPFDLAPVPQRVRYCARGMDQAKAADTRLDGMPMLDCYLLQFWPAAPEPDRVIKQTRPPGPDGRRSS
jgi:hypothetical protein